MFFTKFYSTTVISFKQAWKAILLGLVVLFKILNKVLGFFHLRIITIYCLIAFIVELTTSLISENEAVQVGFVCGLGILIFYWLVQLFRSCSKIVEKEDELKEKKKQQEAENKKNEPIEVKVPFEQEKYTAEDGKTYPMVFQVAQNKKYLMVEYHDRYELYYNSNKGVKFIRKDEKGYY